MVVQEHLHPIHRHSLIEPNDTDQRRIQHQDKNQQRNTQPHQPVPDKCHRSFPLVRCGHQPGGNKEKECHKIGLIDPHDQRHQSLAPAAPKVGRFIVPAAGSPERNSCMMKDNQTGQKDPQFIQIGVVGFRSRGHESNFSGKITKIFPANVRSPGILAEILQAYNLSGSSSSGERTTPDPTMQKYLYTHGRLRTQPIAIPAAPERI